MGTGYTRQSAATIVDGLDIDAAPLNDEFNAIQSAFDGTSGHSHDGTTGEGPKISLTTSISGVLPVANGGIAAIHKINATGAPAVTDDTNSGYGPGSTWTDVTNDQSYICLDATASSAVWKRITLSSSADYQPLDADLTALAALSTTGMMARTAANTYTMRTVTGTANEITVTNGDGVSGNPTISLPSALTFTGKTVTGGTFTGVTLTSNAVTITGGTIEDDVTIVDPSDNTKAARLDVGLVTAGQTRVITVPDRNITLGEGWEVIDASDYTGTGAIAYNNLSAYRFLRFKLVGTVSTDAVNIAIRTSTDNGANHDFGASDYSYSYGYFNSGSAFTSQTANVTSILIASNVDNATPFVIEGTLFEFNQAKVCQYIGSAGHRTGANVRSNAVFSGAREQTTARNAFHILVGSGTMTAHCVLEGMR